MPPICRVAAAAASGETKTPAQAAGVLECVAIKISDGRRTRRSHADIGKLAVAELGQFPDAPVVARPYAIPVEQFGYEHGIFLSKPAERAGNASFF
jgi:hypothetical protein